MYRAEHMAIVLIYLKQKNTELGRNPKTRSGELTYYAICFHGLDSVSYSKADSTLGKLYTIINLFILNAPLDSLLFSLQQADVVIS